MQFLILGPIEVRARGERVPLGSGHQESILAMLLIDPNRVVPLHRLVEAAWDGDSPATARRQVQNTISALRARLARAGPAETIVTDGPGYRAVVRHGELDTDVFEWRVAAARRAAAAGQVTEAAAELRAALDMWRGPALAGIASQAVEAAAVRLNERRLAVLDDYIALCLSLGRHDELLGELAVLTGQHPLHERLTGQLMLALYRSGRQAEALAAFRQLRSRLVGELGVEPGAEVRAMHDAILRNDPALTAPAAVPHPNEGAVAGAGGGGAPGMSGREAAERPARGTVVMRSAGNAATDVGGADYAGSLGVTGVPGIPGRAAMTGTPGGVGSLDGTGVPGPPGSASSVGTADSAGTPGDASGAGNAVGADSLGSAASAGTPTGAVPAADAVTPSGAGTATGPAMAAGPGTAASAVTTADAGTATGPAIAADVGMAASAGTATGPATAADTGTAASTAGATSQGSAAGAGGVAGAAATIGAGTPFDPGTPFGPGFVRQRPPAQLPSDVPDFTGRAADLRWLDDALLDAALPGAALPGAVLPGSNAWRGGATVAAITGTAGVGKTAFAVHWAHQAAERFPDGQLYLNLRGFAQSRPLRPIEALAQLLYALGVGPQQNPVELDEAVGMYRTLMDRKRVLVVLDNAASSDQVRPLIPGSPACRVLVTSRDRLSGLIAREGARRISLDPLAPSEALALLGRILGGARADAAPQATAELARVCAYLPLAIRAAATNLANHPHKTIDSYVSELARIGADRLAALEVDGDEDAAVRAAFDLSYRALHPDVRRGFCFLGLAPGQDITVPASAALTGTTVEAAGRLLDRLAAGHLIGQHSTGRYRMHDLLRHYAAHQADAEHSRGERERAVTRLTGWYLAATDSAARTLYPHLLRLPAPPGAGPVAFASHAEALAWLDAERANLIAVVQYAAAHGPRQVAWLLGDALRGYFTLRRHMVDWLTVARAALAAAGHDKDVRAQSTARLSLAHAYWSLGRYEESGEHYTAALALATEAGWRECRATCLGNLGLVYWEMGRLAEAAGYLNEALEEDRQTERWAGVANNLANLGYVYREMGRLTEAADQCTEALELYRGLGSRGGQANALTNLGQVYHDLGLLDRAMELLTQALAGYQEIGDRSNEADTRAACAAVHRDAGRYRQALDLGQAALDLARQIGDRRTEADALNTLASTCQRLGEFQRARDLHAEALSLARSTGTRYQEAEALIGLGVCGLDLGPGPHAGDGARLALAIAEQTGYRRLEEHARAVLADITARGAARSGRDAG